MKKKPPGNNYPSLIYTVQWSTPSIRRASSPSPHWPHRISHVWVKQKNTFEFKEFKETNQSFGVFKLSFIVTFLLNFCRAEHKWLKMSESTSPISCHLGQFNPENSSKRMSSPKTMMGLKSPNHQSTGGRG